MKAKLQYSNDDTNYTDLGSLRSNERDYMVMAVKERNENGNMAVLGYQITCDVLLFEQDADFLDAAQYYFRLYFENGKVINLGQREYLISTDMALSQPDIIRQSIQLDFFIEADDLISYTTPI